MEQSPTKPADFFRRIFFGWNTVKPIKRNRIGRTSAEWMESRSLSDSIVIGDGCCSNILSPGSVAPFLRHNQRGNAAEFIQKFKCNRGFGKDGAQID